METWSFTLRQEHRLSAFENGVLRKIIVPKTDEVTVYWRVFHNGQVDGLHFSPNTVRLIKSRRMSLAGHSAF